MVFSLRSSIPGHEYLEADYECAPGFYMVSTTNRLLCRNRQWMGQLPKCKIKANFQGACIDASCDHVCKEVDGRPVCSCYKGFRLEDDKCMGKFNSLIFASNIIQIKQYLIDKDLFRCCSKFHLNIYYSMEYLKSIRFSTNISGNIWNFHNTILLNNHFQLKLYRFDIFS